MNRHRNDPPLRSQRDASSHPGYGTADEAGTSHDRHARGDDEFGARPPRAGSAWDRPRHAAGADDYHYPPQAPDRYGRAQAPRSHAGVQHGAYGRYDEDDALPRSMHAAAREESGWGYGDYDAERGLGGNGRRDWPGGSQPYAQPDRQRGDYRAHFGHERGHGHDFGYIGSGLETQSQGPSPRQSGYAEAQGDARHGSGAYGRPRGRPGEDFRGRGPKGYVRSDERVREDVSQLLSDDPHVDASDIDVVVQKGKVTLSGQVSERWAKHRAEDLCEHCAGVVEIDNRIGVKRN